MDWLSTSTKASEFIKKYRYVFLVVLIGIFLMMLPEESDSKTTEKEITETKEVNLETSLEDILTKIEGAGKVSVLLTQSQGEEIVYQQNEDSSNSLETSDIRLETVIITDSNRDEAGLIQRVNAPKYQGAIIVCQGADRAVIRLAIIEAVSKVTGLTSNQISVLKMK